MESKNAAKASETARGRDGSTFMNPLQLCMAVEEVGGRLLSTWSPGGRCRCVASRSCVPSRHPIPPDALHADRERVAS